VRWSRSEPRVAPAVAAVAAALAVVGFTALGDDGRGPRVPAGPPPTPTRVRTGDLFAVERVGCRLRQPVQVLADPARAGRLLVVERAGVIRTLVRCGAPASGRALLDIRDLVASVGEQGLLGVAFDADGRRLYVHHSDRDGDTIVAGYEMRTGRAVEASRRVLLTVDQPYDNHNGGSLAFGPDGRLYLGLGDGGGAFDPGDRSQNVGSLLGKLLRYDPAAPNAGWEIVASGVRNPWRFSFDAATGDLWIGDVGQDRSEEVNRISRDQLLRAGRARPLNLGWPAYEGVERMPGRKLVQSGPLVFPVATYGHTGNCSITGGFVYRGRAIDALRGRYVYGDFCSGRLWSLRASAGDPQVRLEGERLPQLVSFGQDAVGELYAVNMAGEVHRVVRPRA
jgi:glucose/arabinose dehydrogenase